MTRLEIVNSTLIKAGQKTVATVSDTKASRVVNAQYPLSVDCVFIAHPWDQLKKHTSLAHDTIAYSSSDYAYQFTLPIDFIRFVEEEPKGISYDRCAGKLLADETPFKFSYIALPTVSDTSQIPDWDTVPNWSDLSGMTVALDDLSISGNLVDILGYHILSRCIYGITGDHNDTQIFDNLYTKNLIAAKVVNAQEKRDMFITVETDSWEDARV